MSTICLAPLGMQPGAVVAPLLNLGLAQGDEIVLLTTEPLEQAGIAERSEDLLRKKMPFIRVRSVRIAHDVPIDATFDRILLLINGGEAAAVHRLTEDLRARECQNQVLFVESRDQHGVVFDWNGVKTRSFHVQDVGLSDLLSLLGLKKSKSGRNLLSIAAPDTSLRVEELLEKAGALYACVNVDADPGASTRSAINLSRREAYRVLLSWQILQQHLGLELRRLLLTCSNEPRFPRDRWPQRLVMRARRDGIPACGRLLDGSPLDKSRWLGLVSAGEAASLPERLDIGEVSLQPDWSVIHGSAEWKGPPVITLLGTQPGTVLRVLWAHRCTHAFLVYEDASVAVCRNVARLRAALMTSGAESIRFIHMDELGRHVSKDGEHVSLTSGDKSSKFRLGLWAQSKGLSPCYLDGTHATCGTAGAVVPLQTWVQVHADSAVQLPTPTKRQKDAGVVKHAQAAASMVHRALRNGAPLEAGGGPPERVVSAILEACGRVREGGFWLEDITTILLSAVCDETCSSITMCATDDSSEPSDELDAMTSLDGHCTLWSCKAMMADIKVARAARQARAQATRFLGRRELAVVVVPSLHRIRTHDSLRDGWLQFDELTWAVDLSFLADFKKLATLAGTRPSGPRGLGRWNPFIRRSKT